MRYSRIFGSAAIAAVAVGMATPASAALVFNGAYIVVSNSASASSTHGSNSASDSQNDSASTLPLNGLFAEASSDAIVKYRRVTQAEGAADTIGTFNFTDANTGTINFTSLTSATAVNGAASASASTGTNSYATYQFAAGGNDVFHFSYSQSNSLNPYNYSYLYDFTTNSLVFANYANNGSGVNTAALTAGHSYGLYASDYNNSADAVSQSGIGSQTGGSNATYSFSVTTVPEPATWGMMILGFGMIGFGLRARRREAKVGIA